MDMPWHVPAKIVGIWAGAIPHSFFLPFLFPSFSFDKPFLHIYNKISY
jgi:hypothetical protein